MDSFEDAESDATGRSDEASNLTYALRLHERALRDAEEAFAYLSTAALMEIAEEWQQGLADAIASLATYPRRCPLASEQFRREVRHLLYRRPGSSVTHRILFTITGDEPDALEGPAVTVLHIRHANARPINRAEARRLERQE